MEERIHRHPSQAGQTGHHELQPVAGPPPPPETPSVESLLDTQVTVISGAHLQSLPLVNQTVTQARDLLQGPFNIGPEAMPLVNGRPVSADTVLRQGDALEFVHHSGEKGHCEHGFQSVQYGINTSSISVLESWYEGGHQVCHV